MFNLKSGFRIKGFREEFHGIWALKAFPSGKDELDCATTTEKLEIIAPNQLLAKVMSNLNIDFVQGHSNLRKLVKAI